jgi:hypothetical protein
MFPDASCQRQPQHRTVAARRIPASPKNAKASKLNPESLGQPVFSQVLL